MSVTIVLSDSAADELRSQLCPMTPPGPTGPTGGTGGTGPTGPTAPPPAQWPVPGFICFDLPWVSTTAETRLIMPFHCDDKVIVRFTPTSDTPGYGLIAGREWAAPDTPRFAAISTVPGDFTGVPGTPPFNAKSGTSLSWDIATGGPPQNWILVLQAGTTYYLNIENTSCTPGQFTQMFLDLAVPHA